MTSLVLLVALALTMPMQCPGGNCAAPARTKVSVLVRAENGPVRTITKAVVKVERKEVARRPLRRLFNRFGR
jgi:hypothetical protein